MPSGATTANCMLFMLQLHSPICVDHLPPSTTNNKGAQEWTQKVNSSIACMHCFVVVVSIIMIDPKMLNNQIAKSSNKSEQQRGFQRGPPP